MDTSIPGILKVLNGPLPGKNIVILVGVHGNEVCGIRAMEDMLPTLEIERGTLTVALGNPRAVDSGVRLTEANLNRMFRDDALLSDAERATYEYRRSRELMPMLKKADVLLDIHSSGTKDTEPFIICEPNSFSVAGVLPVELVSYNWHDLEPGGTETPVNDRGGIALTIECGYHGDPEAIERAKEAITSFLRAVGAVSGVPLEARKQRLVKALSIHKTTTDFTPARYFRDFEPVREKELIGTDDEANIEARDDGVVIFVRERRGPGEEAFLFGKDEAWPESA